MHKLRMGVMLTAGMLAAVGMSLAAPGRIPESKTWFWMSTAESKLPACAQLDEDPLQFVKREYPDKKPLIKRASETPAGGELILEAGDRDKVYWGFATTEFACYKMRVALLPRPAQPAQGAPTWWGAETAADGRGCYPLTETPHAWMTRVYGNAHRKLVESSDQMEIYEVLVFDGRRHSFTKSKAYCEKFVSAMDRVRQEIAATAQGAPSPPPVSNGLGSEGGGKSTWYVADLNFSRCQVSMSPASRIRMIKEAGKDAKFIERRDAVEVSHQDGTREHYWTYYRTERDCTAALPRSQPIPKRFE
jgi:hypothetical protein